MASKDNPADHPSRSISKMDCTLRREAWHVIQARWGPHTLDLMALDSNAMLDAQGQVLPHFTRFPTPASAGVNVFAQQWSKLENPYVFPPIFLVGPFFDFFGKEITIAQW